MTDMAGVFAQKAALRKAMLRMLRGMSEGELVAQSEAVRGVLMAQPWFKDVKTVACYLSMAKGELRTEAIVRDLLKQGKTLYTPYVPHAEMTATETPAMRMLRMYSTDDLAACPLDKWGIIDPGTTRRDPGREGEERENALEAQDPIDVVLIPGVAFDKECNRLGRGKAFYDRFLADYSSSRGRPRLLALALEPQIVESVPVTGTDFTLDGIVTPSGVIMRST